MFIRRKTWERTLTDRDRAHMRERDGLLKTIADQNDRLMMLAGRQYAPTPLELQPSPDDGESFEDEQSFPDPEQMPDEHEPGW